MTRGQRRAWLALQEQKRRRARQTPVASLVITLTGSVINITVIGAPASDAFWLEESSDGITHWSQLQDQPVTDLTIDLSGMASGFYRVCYEDAGSNSIAPFSNIIFIPAN